MKIGPVPDLQVLDDFCGYFGPRNYVSIRKRGLVFKEKIFCVMVPLSWPKVNIHSTLLGFLCLHARPAENIQRSAGDHHSNIRECKTPAGKDLFSIVPCNSNWQKCLAVELLAIRLKAPLTRISVSCRRSEELKTPSLLASCVAFVPIAVALQ